MTTLEAIKGFSKVKFKDEGIMLPSFKLKRGHNFLSSNDIRSDVPLQNESRFEG